MSTIFDIIVIGAGIMGCSSAYQLARRGLKTALVEKRTIGDSPTGQSSGIISQHYSNELTARLALHSLRVFQNFMEQIGGESGFTPTGFVVLVEEKDRAGLQANVALQRDLGIKSEILSPEDLRDLLPAMEAADLVAAYESESGYADAYLTVNAFAQAARLRGATIYQDTEVTGIRFNGHKIAGVETARGKLDAPLVLNTAGAWGAQVGRLAAIEIPINPCRVQVALFRRPEGHEPPHPVVSDFCNAIQFRSQTGELTLVGLIEPEEGHTIVDPDQYNRTVDTDFVLGVEERLLRRYPAMAWSQRTGGYASLYGITPDWHPVVDEVPAGSGFYVCAGFSGHGFKLGPAVGLMIADLITGESDPEFDPHLFRLSRYDEDEPVRSQYEYGIAG